MIDEKDMDRIMERVKEVCVTRQECQDTTRGLEGKIGSSSVRMAIIETELKQIKWLVGLVLAGTVANLVNSFFHLIGG